MHSGNQFHGSFGCFYGLCVLSRSAFPRLIISFDQAQISKKKKLPRYFIFLVSFLTFITSFSLN